MTIILSLKASKNCLHGILRFFNMKIGYVNYGQIQVTIEYINMSYLLTVEQKKRSKNNFVCYMS